MRKEILVIKSRKRLILFSLPICDFVYCYVLFPVLCNFNFTSRNKCNRIRVLKPRDKFLRKNERATILIRRCIKKSGKELKKVPRDHSFSSTNEKKKKKKRREENRLLVQNFIALMLSKWKLFEFVKAFTEIEIFLVKHFKFICLTIFTEWIFAYF